MQAAAAALRNALARPLSPDPKRLAAADPDCIDGGHALRAKIEFVNFPTRLTGRNPARQYLRRNEEELAGFEAAAFRPPLDHLKRLIHSIEVR